MHLYELNKKLTVARERFFIYTYKQTNNKTLFTSTIYKQKLLPEISNADVS